MTDLATAAASGDRGALDTLLARHVDRIHAVCRRILGNDHDALDATQEALIAVTRGIGSFDGRAQFSTWCYRDRDERSARRDPAPEPAAPTGRILAGGCFWRHRRRTTRVADALDVDAALARLPEEQRAAVVLQGSGRARLRRDRGRARDPSRNRPIAHRSGPRCARPPGEPGHRRRTSKPETPVNTPMDPLTPDAVDELLSAEIDGEFDAAALDLGYEPGGRAARCSKAFPVSVNAGPR